MSQNQMIFAVEQKGEAMRLIDADALYEKAASLEAQALNYVEKLMERDGREVSTEFRIWSAILAERTAFKHDVFDAPTIKKSELVIAWMPLPEPYKEVDDADSK